MPISQLIAYLKKKRGKEKRGHIGANHLTTDRGLGWEIIVHVHSVNLYYLICDILIIELFILASCPTCLLLPPVIPCHIFISWYETMGRGREGRGGGVHLSLGPRINSSPPMTSCSPRGAFTFLMWLCVELEDGTRRRTSLGVCLSFRWDLGGWEVPPSSLLSSPLHTSAQGVKRPHTLPPTPIIYQDSFHWEKKNKVQLSIFHLCTEKFIIPIPYTLITSVCISYPFHLKSTVLYIYYDYTRFVFLFFSFFYCGCFCAAPHPFW